MPGMDPVDFPPLRPGESAENAGWSVLRGDAALSVIAPDGTTVCCR